MWSSAENRGNFSLQKQIVCKIKSMVQATKILSSIQLHTTSFKKARATMLNAGDILFSIQSYLVKSSRPMIMQF